MHKGSTFFPEISKFFKKDNADSAISHLSRLFEGLRLSEKTVLGHTSRPNSKYSLLGILSVLIMFPCFMIRNPYRYEGSSLCRMFGCDKDVFYRFLNSDAYDWRKVLTQITSLLWKRVCVRSDHGHRPVCLIVDDTDMPKRGIHMEIIFTSAKLQRTSAKTYRR